MPAPRHAELALLGRWELKLDWFEAFCDDGVGRERHILHVLFPALCTTSPVAAAGGRHRSAFDSSNLDEGIPDETVHVPIADTSTCKTTSLWSCAFVGRYSETCSSDSGFPECTEV